MNRRDEKRKVKVRGDVKRRFDNDYVNIWMRSFNVYNHLNPAQNQVVFITA